MAAARGEEAQGSGKTYSIAECGLPSRYATDVNCNRKSAIANPRLSERPAKVVGAVQAFFDDVDARGVAKPDGAVVAECGSGNNGDIGFAQQTVGEILRSQSELADVD